MGSIKFRGFDNMQKKFKQMQRATEELSRTHEIPFPDLFTTAFMRKYTSFVSFVELMDAGGFHAESSEEFEAIPEDLFDKHIAATTRFKSWQEMLDTATEQYISRKLGF